VEREESSGEMMSSKQKGGELEGWVEGHHNEQYTHAEYA